jgi:hypothetical protein
MQSWLVQGVQNGIVKPKVLSICPCAADERQDALRSDDACARGCKTRGFREPRRGLVPGATCVRFGQ